MTMKRTIGQRQEVRTVTREDCAKVHGAITEALIELAEEGGLTDEAIYVGLAASLGWQIGYYSDPALNTDLLLNQLRALAVEYIGHARATKARREGGGSA